MLPKISIPQKYDLVNNALLIEEYKAAKDAKLSPVILASMEVEIALKRFSHDRSVTPILNWCMNLTRCIALVKTRK